MCMLSMYMCVCSPCTCVYALHVHVCMLSMYMRVCSPCTCVYAHHVHVCMLSMYMHVCTLCTCMLSVNCTYSKEILSSSQNISKDISAILGVKPSLFRETSYKLYIRQQIYKQQQQSHKVNTYKTVRTCIRLCRTNCDKSLVSKYCKTLLPKHKQL